MVGAGWLTPEQFWNLSPIELHWLVEARKPVKMIGSQTEDQVRELYALAYGED